jgi:hypothetical protein
MFSNHYHVSTSSTQALKEMCLLWLVGTVLSKTAVGWDKKYRNHNVSHVLNNIKDKISIMLAHNVLKHYRKVPHILHPGTK